MSSMVDRLVQHKIVCRDVPEAHDKPCPRYSADVEAALEAAGVFTRGGASVRILKVGAQVWEVTAWVGKQRQHTECGSFASALCRAMLAAVGVKVQSSDDK